MWCMISIPSDFDVDRWLDEDHEGNTMDEEQGKELAEYVQHYNNQPQKTPQKTPQNTASRPQDAIRSDKQTIHSNHS